MWDIEMNSFIPLKIIKNYYWKLLKIIKNYYYKLSICATISIWIHKMRVHSACEIFKIWKSELFKMRFLGYKIRMKNS